MPGISPHQPQAALVQAASLRQVVIDELSSVRHLHVTAMQQLAAQHLSETEVAALIAYIRSEQYTARLIEAVRNGRLIGAELMGALAATAGWVAANDAGATARIMAVCVSPLYSRIGLARRALQVAETDAARAGFKVFTVRAPIGAVPFFERLGYGVTSHGVWPLPPDQAIPVGFLRKVAAGPAA